MKNIFKSLMLVAVAAMTFTACQSDLDEVNATDRSFAINAVASFEDATRSGFDSYTPAAGNKDAYYSSKWDGGESVTAYLGDTGMWSLWAKEGAKMQIPAGGDGKTATFVAEFDLIGEYDEIPESGTITAYVPSESWVNNAPSSTSNEGMQAVIPTFQTPLEKSVDPAAHILMGVGKIENAKVDNVEFKFSHVGAYGKMTLKGLDATFVPVKAELEFKDKEGNITIITLDTKNVKNNEYWFTVNPMEVASFNVVVTDKDGEVYSKAATVGSSNSLNFVKGQVSVFNVSMTEGDLPYVGYDDNSYMVYAGKNGYEAKPAFQLYIYNEGSDKHDYMLFLVCEEALFDVIPEGVYNYSKTAVDGQYILGPSSRENVADANVEVKHVVEKNADGDVTFGGYKLNITVKDVDGSVTKYRFLDTIDSDPDNHAFGVNNPPIPYNEATLECTVVEPDHEQHKPASAKYVPATKDDGDTYTLQFEVNNNDTKDDKRYYVEFDLETSQASNGLIPEGTYELGGKDNLIKDGYADYYSTDAPINLTKGSVKVEYTTDNKYKFTVNVTNEMKTTFKFTYTGRFDVSGDFRNPGDLPRLATPNVKAEVVNNTSIKLSWDAVEGATKYIVTWNEGTNSKEVTETTATIENLDSFEYYTFQVVATGDVTKVKDSHEANISAETLIDPENDSAWVEETVVFTNGNLDGDPEDWYNVKLTNSDGSYFVLNINGNITENDLPKPGCYLPGYITGNSEIDKEINIDANLTSYSGSSTSIKAFYVAVDNGVYTLSIYSEFFSQELNQSIRTKFTYTGSLLDEDAELEISGDYDYTFTSKSESLNGNWLEIAFTDDTNTFTTSFGIGATDNCVGMWDYNNSYSSGYALGNGKFNSTEDNVFGHKINVAESDNGYTVVISWYDSTAAKNVTAIYDGPIDNFVTSEVVPLPDVEFEIPGDGTTFDYDIKFDKVTSSMNNNQIYVGNANGNTWDIRFHTALSSIEAGTYKAVQSFSSDAALEVDTYNGGINLSSGYMYADSYDDTQIDVQLKEGVYCITMIASNGYGMEAGKTYRFVYIGRL